MRVKLSRKSPRWDSRYNNEQQYEQTTRQVREMNWAPQNLWLSIDMGTG